MAVPVLTPAEVNKIKGHIDDIRSILDGKDITKNLTTDETGNLNVIGKQRKPAAQKALEIAQLKPGILPGDFSLDDFEKGMDLIFTLEGKVSFSIMSLFEVVEESRFFFSDKAWDQARQVKQYLETANRTDPGLDALVNELNEHFERAPLTGEDDTGPEPPL